MAFKLFSFGPGVEKNITPQEKAEIKNLNQSTDYQIRDPYRNTMEGIVNVPGQDVVDPANYYNESGFEKFEDEVEAFDNPIDNSKKGGEVEAFMEKYNLEEFELEDLMKNCDAYLNGKKNQAPLRDSHDLEELASLYRDYEEAKHGGLPFSDEELSKISESDQEELLNLYQKRADLIFKVPENNGPTLTLRPEVVAKKIEEIEKRINELEAPIYRKVLKVDRELEKRAQDARDNDPKVWKDVPKYSEADLALQKNVLAYIRQEEGAKKPVFSSGEKLTREQIEDVLREIAEDEKWPQGKFFAEVRKINKNGREQNIRQLATVQNLANGRRAKYTFASDDFPAGQYFYQVNPKFIVISKNDPNLAFAPISLLIGAEKPKKNVPADIAASKTPEIVDKPKPVIIKKEKAQTKVGPTIIKKGSSVEKPKPVIKKRAPEEVI